jgi:hypothetical protein
MQSILDDAKSWFIDAIVYQDDLLIRVVEGLVDPVPEDLVIGQTNLGPVNSIEVGENSRRVVVRFARCVSWQVVNESFTSFDEYEMRDDTGFLQILERSKYLDYVLENHGWFREVVGPAKHYRLLTENEVVDIVAFDCPTFEQ